MDLEALVNLLFVCLRVLKMYVTGFYGLEFCTKLGRHGTPPLQEPISGTNLTLIVKVLDVLRYWSLHMSTNQQHQPADDRVSGADGHTSKSM